MNIERLRKSLKVKWLDYYQENRGWLVKLGVWVTYEGQRRPSASFILATLSVLEPRLTQLLPLIVDLNHNPDRIVVALGLNFNPDQELKGLGQGKDEVGETESEPPKALPGSVNSPQLELSRRPTTISSLIDESCRGSKRERE